MAIKDLNVNGIMKNRHLSKVVKDQSFYKFRTKLENKCRYHQIELRIAKRFYPSSKISHTCTHKTVDLKLND